MKAFHDPLSPASRCPGCVTDPGGFDHESVRQRRPSDFDAQVVALMREGIKKGSIAGVTLGPHAASKALAYLRDIGAEPRRPRIARRVA